jgi:hypothetical protein
MQRLVNAQDLADALNKLRLADPMWAEGGFRVGGRWLEIDPEASDHLAARMLGCDVETARQRNDTEARWLVAGGVGVFYTDRRGWQPAASELVNGFGDGGVTDDEDATESQDLIAQ